MHPHHQQPPPYGHQQPPKKMSPGKVIGITAAVVGGVFLSLVMLGTVLAAISPPKPKNAAAEASPTPSASKTAKPKQTVKPSPSPSPTPSPPPKPTPARTTASQPADENQPDEKAYLDHLYTAAADAGSGIYGFGDEKNLELGYAVCDDIKAGMAPAEVARGLRGAGGAIGKVAPEIVGFAQVYLCPGT